MLKGITKRKSLVVIFVLLMGVVSVFLYSSFNKNKVPPHTHIYFKDIDLHVWSYLKVKKVTIGNNSIKVDSYINAEINEAVKVKFQNGSKIYKKDKISINNKIVHLDKDRVNNILIKRNDFEKGAYIQVFERRYIWPLNFLKQIGT